MSHNKKPLWNKNSEYQPLRIPMMLAQRQNITEDLNTSTSQNNIEKRRPSMQDIVANSSLKIDAPEFIPRYSESKSEVSQLTSHIQNRLKLNRSEPECKATENVENNLENYTNNMDTESDLRRITQIISTLTKDPGQLDNLLQIFMETVLPYLEDIFILRQIVEILVNGAIESANFRYTGAKLCWYIEPNCPTFRPELHLTCRQKLEQGGGKLQNVLLFIAELYVQLPHINMYGALLVNAFDKLLGERSDESIKCICQALKLTGFSLESSNKNDLDDIITKLEALKNLNGTTSNLVNRILELRNSNWGMADTEQLAIGENHLESNYEYDAPDHLFFEENLLNNSYLSDNTVLTQEEEEFLTANLILNQELYSHPDVEDDPQIDEELEEAYEEFLKTIE